ncbi:hypothetical protein [Limosilactobacillus fermentum]|uniref:hypothetical protein n=1 Tax=Limosilactobacillus fermentum TaxID=1613 RepID=UPI0021A5EBE8|nr:hypothetical protein [Limosilactobacillus fermentum]MCT2870484.1 hypothetical protein [Limosilactobacillus fermentum]
MQYKRNNSLMITSIETVMMGLVMIFNHPYDDPTRPVFHAMNLFQSWPMCASLLVLGGGVLILTICNYHKYFADFVATVLMAALWMAYLVAFFVQDAFSRSSVSVATILIGFVFIRILLDAFFHFERGVWCG